MALNNMYYVTVSVSQESQCSLAGSAGSGSLTGSHQSDGLSCSHLIALCMGKVCFQAHSSGCRQDSVPPWLLAGGHPQLLGTGASPSASLTVTSGFIQVSRQEVSERVPPGQKSPLPCELISEVTSCPFYHRLFIRIESLYPGEKITQRCEVRKRG